MNNRLHNGKRRLHRNGILCKQIYDPPPHPASPATAGIFAGQTSLAAAASRLITSRYRYQFVVIVVKGSNVVVAFVGGGYYFLERDLKEKCSKI